MVFKMALIEVLEKKEMYFYFQLEFFLRLFEVMIMIFISLTFIQICL